MKTFYHPLILILLLIFFSACSENNKKNELSDNGRVQKTTVEIPIEGMSCMACVAKIKNTLLGIEGVNDVKVSLKNKNSIFSFNPQKISLDKIVQSINEIGYRAGKPEISEE